MDCGVDVNPGGYTETPRCDACRKVYYQKDRIERRRVELEKAEEVPYEGGMVLCEDVDNSRDGWHDSFESLLDEIEENHFNYESGKPLPRPEWCHPATPEVRFLDLKEAITDHLERLCEDGYEDMDIEPDAELLAAVDAFNERNTREFTIWHADMKKKIRIPPATVTNEQKPEPV